MTFGEFVRQKRLAVNLELREFCDQAQFDPSNWSKVERGKLLEDTFIVFGLRFVRTPLIGDETAVVHQAPVANCTCMGSGVGKFRPSLQP
jgi:hypothetical protein